MEQTGRVKACGVFAAVAIGIALPVGGIVLGALSASLAPMLWALTVVVLIGLVGVAWNRLRYDLTRKNGVLTSATIVDVSTVDLGQIEKLYEVEYTYLDQNGVTHKGKSGHVRSIPLTTDEHFVRYDPSTPDRSVWIS